MISPNEAIVKAIANELDGRERWILAWVQRQVNAPYREISGDTLDALIKRGLLICKPTPKPRATWPVVCTELGSNVAQYLTMKTERGNP
jgi:hypothetical protein